MATPPVRCDGCHNGCVVACVAPVAILIKLYGDRNSCTAIPGCVANSTPTVNVVRSQCVVVVGWHSVLVRGSRLFLVCQLLFLVDASGGQERCWWWQLCKETYFRVFVAMWHERNMLLYCVRWLRLRVEYVTRCH